MEHLVIININFFKNHSMYEIKKIRIEIYYINFIWRKKCIILKVNLTRKGKNLEIIIFVK